MEAKIIPVLNKEGKEVGTFKIDTSVFSGQVHVDAVYQAVTAYRAASRRGLASTKTRGDVSGGGRKPWKQKGTGRARVGSTRSPLWRHGGVTFGPSPRDFSFALPRKIKDLALKSVICAKLNENNLIVLDEFKPDAIKTKEAMKMLQNISCGFSKENKRKKGKIALLLLPGMDKKALLSLRNIDRLDFNSAMLTNAYEVLTARKLVITKDAFTQLTERLKG